MPVWLLLLLMLVVLVVLLMVMVAHQRAMKEALSVNEGIYVPAVYSQYSTRRLLVTEWIDG